MKSLLAIVSAFILMLGFTACESIKGAQAKVTESSEFKTFCEVHPTIVASLVTAQDGLKVSHPKEAEDLGKAIEYIKKLGLTCLLAKEGVKDADQRVLFAAQLYGERQVLVWGSDQSSGLTPSNDEGLGYVAVADWLPYTAYQGSPSWEADRNRRLVSEAAIVTRGDGTVTYAKRVVGCVFWEQLSPGQPGLYLSSSKVDGNQARGVVAGFAPGYRETRACEWVVVLAVEPHSRL